MQPFSALHPPSQRSRQILHDLSPAIRLIPAIRLPLLAYLGVLLFPFDGLGLVRQSQEKSHIVRMLVRFLRHTGDGQLCANTAD